MKLKKWIQSTGELPAGADQHMLYRVFTNQDKICSITTINWRSGDSMENYQMVCCPPSSNLDGTEEWADLKGAFFINAVMKGGAGTTQVPFALLTAQGTGFPFCLIPPYWSLAVCDVTAASANNFVVWVGGYELE
jgi:hypothetical protein